MGLQRLVNTVESLFEGVESFEDFLQALLDSGGFVTEFLGLVSFVGFSADVGSLSADVGLALAYHVLLCLLLWSLRCCCGWSAGFQKGSGLLMLVKLPLLTLQSLLSRLNYYFRQKFACLD